MYIIYGLLRNIFFDIFRLYSRFLSRIPRYPPFKGATPKMFHDFVVKGVACYKKCFKKHSIRECAYNKTLYDEAVVRGRTGEGGRGGCHSKMFRALVILIRN